MTALHVCAEQGHADVMELLIKAGAEVLFQFWMEINVKNIKDYCSFLLPYPGN